MGMLGFSQLLITKAFWGDCINLFLKWVGNYGVAIILLTVALKLVLMPIEIMQKRVNKRNAKMQAIMQPELLMVQQQYPGDRAKLNQKQMELAKKYNFNMTGTCVTLLASLIITITIFTSLFTGLNALSSKQENIAFNEVYQTYITATDYTNNHQDEFLTESVFDETKASQYVEQEVEKVYKKQSKKNSFLWVKNVWKGDTDTSPVVSMKSFEKYAKKHEINLGDNFEKDYNTIKAIIHEDRENNGYFILIILAGLITFLAQYFQVKIQEKKTGIKNPSAKTMFIIMPIFMLIFAWTSSALFTLYIITNSIMSALISTVIDLCQSKDKDDNTQVVYKKGNTEVVEYSRNYKKG